MIISLCCRDHGWPETIVTHQCSFRQTNRQNTSYKTEYWITIPNRLPEVCGSGDPEWILIEAIWGELFIDTPAWSKI
jgi:hypothetical protein